MRAQKIDSGVAPSGGLARIEFRGCPVVVEGSGDHPTVSHVVDREWEFQESLSGKLPGEGEKERSADRNAGEEVWGQEAGPGPFL